MTRTVRWGRAVPWLVVLPTALGGTLAVTSTPGTGTTIAGVVSA
jgi:hypothetical protein